MSGETIKKQMGVTHAEFYRMLGNALRGGEFQREGSNITVPLGDGHVAISLSEEKIRVLSKVVQLPYTDVEISFHEVDSPDRQEFMRRYQLAFQRGGG